MPVRRPSALLRRVGQGCRGHREDREIRGLGQRADRGVGRHAEDRGGTGVHREEPSGEAALVQMVQEGPPHRSRPAPGAYHGDRIRPQQRLQAGHVGGPAAGLDGREIAVVVLVVVLVQCDDAAHLRTLETACGAQAQVGEEPKDFVVLRECVRRERGDAVRTGGGDQMLDQEGADATVVQSVGHRDGDLGRGRFAADLVLGQADHLLLRLGHQRPVAGARRRTGPVGGHRCGTPARREEPQPQILRGHLLVEPLQSLMITWPHRAYAHGGAVREQGMDRGSAERVIRHRGSPPKPSDTSSIQRIGQ